MVVLFAIYLFFTILFLSLFLHEIYKSFLFFKIGKHIALRDTRKIKFQRKIKSIVKKTYVLLLTKKRFHIQSINFYAKFLYGKEYQKFTFACRLKINDIYMKLSKNYPIFYERIDFNRLYNSGLFNGKPIFKMHLPHGRDNVEDLLMAVSEVQKHIPFRCIFLTDKSSQYEREYVENKFINIDFKFIDFNDINLVLLQELNKVDLNYDNRFLDDHFSDKDIEILTNGIEWKCQKFLNLKDINIQEFRDANLCYDVNINNPKTINKIKLKINIKIPTIYFNYQLNKNDLIINFYDKKYKDIIYNFNGEIKDIRCHRYENNIFLIVHFYISLIDNINNKFFLIENYNIAEEYEGISKKLILKNKLNLENLFKIKIYTKNEKFNNYFNKILKENILNEKYNKNIQKNNNYYLFISKLFNINYKDLILNYSSQIDLYQLILCSIFGINLSGNILTVQPDKNRCPNLFKLVVNSSGQICNIWVSKTDMSSLKIDGVLYSNFQSINLDMLKENNVKLIV